MNRPLVACDTPSATIRQRGQHEVFCGLTSIIWLHRKVQDAFFLVVGSRTCAHLIQSAAGVMIFSEPRFATAIMEERDLAGMVDMHDELDREVARLLERRPDIRMLVLVGSCPSEVIKFDLNRAAERLDRKYGSRPRVLCYSGSGIETTFTQGEDNFLAALVRDQSTHGASDKVAKLVVAGSIADVVEDQFARLFDEMDLEDVVFLPGRSSERLPKIGPNTRFILAQPYLGATAAALESLGATRINALFPLGEEGTTAWLKAIADTFGVSPARFATLTEAPRRRAREATAHYRPMLEGKRIFLFPDSQMEPSLAAISAASWMPRSSKSAAPICTANTSPASSPCCRPVSRFRKVRMSKSRSTAVVRPSPISSSAAWVLPIPSRRKEIVTKWSIEFAFTPIQGYEQAGDLAELFARPLTRKAMIAGDRSGSRRVAS